jgi:hypothetical protein
MEAYCVKKVLRFTKNKKYPYYNLKNSHDAIVHNTDAGLYVQFSEKNFDKYFINTQKRRKESIHTILTT